MLNYFVACIKPLFRFNNLEFATSDVVGIFSGSSKKLFNEILRPLIDQRCFYKHLFAKRDLMRVKGLSLNKIFLKCTHYVVNSIFPFTIRLKNIKHSLFKIIPQLKKKKINNFNVGKYLLFIYFTKQRSIFKFNHSPNRLLQRGIRI